MQRQPYAVWVSEVLLQQTTVATVRKRFAGWLERFPGVRSLAAAPLDEVLAAWEGLGYYRRARHLHAAAQRVVAEHGGELPGDPAALAQLPGLGRYAANAVACFAFGRKAPIVEANTSRLWSRLAALPGAATNSAVKAAHWRLAEAALPERQAADFNYALMDLGAGLCTPRQPACESCPVAKFCRAFQLKTPHAYPEPAAKEPPTPREDVAAVVWRGRRALVVRRPETGLWAGLWEFPRVERQAGESLEQAALRAAAIGTDRPCQMRGERAAIRHTVTRFRVTLHCFELAAVGPLPAGGADRGLWLAGEELDGLAFSTPQRRLAREVAARPESPPTLFPA